MESGTLVPDDLVLEMFMNEAARMLLTFDYGIRLTAFVSATSDHHSRSIENPQQFSTKPHDKVLT